VLLQLLPGSPHARACYEHRPSGQAPAGTCSHGRVRTCAASPWACASSQAVRTPWSVSTPGWVD